MATLPWQTGTVEHIIQETWNTRRYFIRLKDASTFDFKAGQFVTLDLPIGEKPIQRWRSYSIASHPDGSNVIELLIVLLEGGAGSTYIFNEINEGSELVLRGPLGVFTLPDDIDKDVFFICTGTGIAPFRSMVYDIRRRNIFHKNLYLIYGCRTTKDLLYFKEMQELQEQMESFHFIPTLSRELWEGKRGYVHALYEDICKKNNELCENLENLHPTSFYLCGWKFMIDDARKKIAELGYDRKAIHFELYG